MLRVSVLTRDKNNDRRAGRNAVVFRHNKVAVILQMQPLDGG